MPEAPPTVRQVLATAQAACGIDARLDLELLLGEVLGLTRAGLIREGTSPVSTATLARFEQSLAAYREGRPVAQLLGRREFWSRELLVNEHVLVPRPDTELLVEVALELLVDSPPGPVLDLGTGSGAIALALACERPDLVVIALDASWGALKVAQANVARHVPGRVELLAARWLDPVAPASCALIVSNPPYLDETDPGLAAAGALRFEPRPALASGPEGLDDLTAIIATTPDKLRPGGWLALEHGATQGPAVRRLLAVAGFSSVATRRDLAGLERVSLGRKPADLLPCDDSPILA